MDIAAASPLPSPRHDAPLVSGRRIDWTARDVLIGVLLFVGAFILLPIPIALPLAFVYATDAKPFLYVEVLIAFPLYLVFVAIAALRTFGKYGGGWERLGFSKPTLRTLLWGLGAFVGAIALSLIYGVVIDVFNVDFLKQGCGDQVPADLRNDATLLALSGFSAVIFAPLAEETFFRGFVFTGLARSWGPVAGIVVSGLLFGSAHLVGNPLLYKSLIQLSLIGMVFAFVYWRSGNILSTMLGHFTFNLIGIILVASTTCRS